MKIKSKKRSGMWLSVSSTSTTQGVRVGANCAMSCTRLVESKVRLSAPNLFSFVSLHRSFFLSLLLSGSPSRSISVACCMTLTVFLYFSWLVGQLMGIGSILCTVGILNCIPGFFSPATWRTTVYCRTNLLLYYYWDLLIKPYVLPAAFPRRGAVCQGYPCMGYSLLLSLARVP